MSYYPYAAPAYPSTHPPHPHHVGGQYLQTMQRTPSHYPHPPYPTHASHPAQYHQSHPHSGRHRHRRHLTIVDLPTETLLAIFELLAEDPHREKSLARPQELKLNFPYNVTFTCKKWNAIMFRTPEFWTDIRVYLGYAGRLTSLQSIQMQLRASYPNRVNIHIKMARDEAMDDPIARSGYSNFPSSSEIGQVFNLLAQQGDRVETMYIKNSWSGYPYGDEWGMPMTCGNFSWVSDRYIAKYHPFDRVEEVVLDGSSFLDCCSVKNFWSQSRLKRVTVRHLHVQDQSFGIRQLVQQLDSIPYLSSVDFEDVQLADMYSSAANGPHMKRSNGEDVFVKVKTAAFVKVEEQFVRAMLANAPMLEHIDLHFYQCERFRFDQPINAYTANLYLYDIQGSSFGRIIRNFNKVQALYINRCPAFNDRYLADLVAEMQRNPKILRKLQTLSVDECHDFTFAGFSRLLHTLASRNGGRGKVDLHCLDVPRISRDERAWMQKVTQNPMTWKC